MKKVLFLCSVATSTILACTDLKHSPDLFSDGYQESSSLSQEIQPSDTLYSATIIDYFDPKTIKEYDGITYDSANDCYYATIPHSQQSRFRSEDGVFIELAPKKILGGVARVVSEKRDCPNCTYLLGLVERASERGSFK